MDTRVRRVSALAMETPPDFGMVGSGIYRSSFPKPEHFPFLKTLGLKSILLLLPEEYPAENLEFCEENGIRLFQVGLSGNKEPFVHVKLEDLENVLRIALNPANQPLLIHCNMGKHRTGCVVGCIRRLQNWALALIFEEYRHYAYPKVRALDYLIIEMFNDRLRNDATVQIGIDQFWA